MNDVPISTIVILVVLFILSAFFSGSETAFSSANKIRLKNYVDEGRRGSKNALYIAENFDKALITILIGNNIANIAASAVSAQLATQLIGDTAGIVLSTFVMTVLILIFGEILPKSFAKEYAEKYSLATSKLMLVLMKIFTPVSFLLMAMKTSIKKRFKIEKEEPTVTEEEIKVMVDMGEEEGVLENEEKELIHRSLDFHDIIVAEIFTPRQDMVTVDVDDSIEKIRETFLKERFSRIPVYEEDYDKILGILMERDFLNELLEKGKDRIDIRSLLREPIFVAKSMKISKLLPELQVNVSPMAIVVDEFGGTAGLITLEDILEEIVGEIWDEHEEVIKEFTLINNHTYEFNAAIELTDFAEVVGIEPPESHYYSLSGWLLEIMERIPDTGDTINYENLTLTIQHVEDRRIRTVLVEVREKSTE